METRPLVTASFALVAGIFLAQGLSEFARPSWQAILLFSLFCLVIPITGVLARRHPRWIKFLKRAQIRMRPAVVILICVPLVTGFLRLQVVQAREREAEKTYTDLMRGGEVFLTGRLIFVESR